MSFRIIILTLLVFSFCSCGVKSKPSVPRDPNLDLYIQDKLKKQDQENHENEVDKKKKQEGLSN